MDEFFPFFLVLFSGLFFSVVFKRLHLPWVVVLILSGIIMGPSGMGVLVVDDFISFMGQIGLVFLMFMAGIETKLSHASEVRRGALELSLLNGAIPFAVGFGLAMALGYDLTASLLLGIIFISSSIAVVIPSLEVNKILDTRLGKSIVTTTMIEDIVSLVLLSFLLQTIDPITSLPLPLFFLILFISLYLLRIALPSLRTFSSIRINDTLDGDPFQRELRATFLVLVGTVLIFDLLGLHPIIAGFFAGLILSDSIKTRELGEKLRTMSYGLFIPIFFVVVGAQTNIEIFFAEPEVVGITFIIVISLLLSKILSGFAGGRFIGFSSLESLIIGVATIPQLSTALAVVFIGVEYGLLDPQVLTAVVSLSIITTLLSPLFIRILAKKLPVTEPIGVAKKEEEELLV